MTHFSWVTFLSSLLGSGATAWAVFKFFGHHIAERWLAKYKNDLDKEFEGYRHSLEEKGKRLEAELSHRIYISQTQFDAEFNALKDIFSALGKVRLSFNGMRPMMSWGSTEQEAKLKQLAIRLDDFKQKYNKLVDTAESFFPFIPEEIYHHIGECMRISQLEIMHIETAGSDTFGFKWYTEGTKQQEKFAAAYFMAAKLVRERFKSLAIR